MNTTIYLFAISFILSFNLAAQRNIQSLNSAWEFSLEKNDKKEIVNIPHTWNAEDAFRDGKEYFRGKGTYEKTLFAPVYYKNKRVFLKFEGSNQITGIFVNNEKIGEHRGGYIGFVFDISEALNIGEENQIRIEVDNAHNTDIPPLDADFNFYGGIYRDLELIVTEQVHFELANEAAGNILVKTPQVSEDKADIRIETKVVNNSVDKKSIEVSIDIFDPETQHIKKLSKKVQMKAGETNSVIFTHEIKTPGLWSPDTPNIYRIEARISEVNSEKILDDLFTKFGLRWFEIDAEEGFFLNGKPLKLIGANRHQDFKGLGNALPNVIHQTDYKTIKEMGANFIRTAHYPQDPEVYKICDELGLLVWSEVPIINDVTDTAAYHEISLKMQREQILQFFNHPSIVFWGYMNEIYIRLVFNNKITEAEKEAKIKTSVALAKKLENETKKLDPDRLSVMALHENELYNTSGIADIPDVIGWNLYFGWYSQGLENFGKFLDDQHKHYPDRPLIISEYGPGADIRIQTDDPKPWDYSEAYQLKLHESYLNQVLERDFIVGMAAWNFADFGSSFRQDAMPYINQKGLVNFDRSKKDIYYYYQARLLKEPFIYIEGANYDEKFLQDENDKVKINVFSNAKKVTLNVNDSLEFYAEVKNGLARFELQLPEGKHLLIAETEKVSHSRKIKVRYRSNLLYEIGKKNLLINVGTHVNYTDPVTKEIWISDQEYKIGGFGHVGGKVFQKSEDKFQGTASDIQGTEDDPLFQTMREGIKAYNFDVEKGDYKISLLFAEPDFNASEENIYNLDSSKNEKTINLRSFDIKINGKIVSKDFNLARDYGRIRAVEVFYKIKAENGITVEFEENSGKSVLSGIKLEKL
ncbi:glycoside hydrolase family 2 [Gillisia limnaea]|uniref:Glycoside hydrolase family 2 sugar binding n=1 Tax=Gillisia limnaea (strain DSM 15749 / LMG 21470 / R-8282) TaxID=865937 RepID=H2C0B0_GILLR|nr:glycoside hydrolase family 2 [Gillisia limnaea]EHQ03526.1 glycoside hydrolase family 2 sugar binding [Gillisia limnaea DSM 15749]